MPVLHKSVLFFLLPLAVLTTHAQRRLTDTLTIHFAFDRSDLRPADSDLLHHIAGLSPDSISIIGHADIKGSIAYNQQLSIRRARSAEATVQNLLAANPPAIRSEGRGKSQPLPGDDSLSRRVIVIVYYHEKPAPPIARIDTPPPRIRAENEPDTIISLNNINFIANTPVLTDAARMAMPQTIDNLRTFSDRYLEIDGFCNAPGPPLPTYDPLFKLSVERAKYIYDMLIDHGFDSTRLRYKGLGNTSPVNAHPTTAAEMDKNMRVEIKVFHRLPQP